MTSVSVNLICRNKMLYTGWLKQQKFISSQFWRLEVQDQGLTGFRFSWESPFGLQMVPSVCMLTWLFLDTWHRDRLSSLLIRMSLLPDQGPTFMTSFYLLKILSPNVVTLGLQQKNFGGTEAVRNHILQKWPVCCFLFCSFNVVMNCLLKQILCASIHCSYYF